MTWESSPMRALARRFGLTCLFATAAMLAGLAAQEVRTGAPAPRWRQHDNRRPRPPVVEPAEETGPTRAPRDAVVLFDGSSLDAWKARSGGPAGWRVADGYMETRPGAGAIETKARFGDIQLHVEWAAPSPPAGVGQDRGNSGVFLMRQFEVQVLDSYKADTYADGQAGAIYGQYPPLFNASRPPGQWQSYDIAFRRPRFERSGALLEPARVTVFHNGILVQNNEETGSGGPPTRTAATADRSRSRITTTRCAIAISGSASSPSGQRRPPRTSPGRLPSRSRPSFWTAMPDST
jgi:hypothetical protein